ncbi:MAG: hypothetical protein ABWZ74_06805 [Hyphomicrobiaceae bacterium]
MTEKSRAEVIAERIEKTDAAAWERRAELEHILLNIPNDAADVVMDALEEVAPKAST